MKGCHCNTGFTSYDCSKKLCPVGDDPDTEGQLDERQRLTCTHKGAGSFNFVFRGETAAAVTTAATTWEVKAALESLDGIGEVKVELEDLPELTLILSGITSDDLQVKESVIGTKESIECSGRGIRETSLGSCTCFSGYSSSDDKGGKGTIPNCGFREKILSFTE